MKRVWLFIGIIDILAVSIIAYSLHNPTPILFLKASIIAALVVVAELYPLEIFDEGDLTLSALVQIVALIVFGFEAAILGDVIGVVVYSLITRRPVIKTLFNAGQYTVANAASYYVLILSGGTLSQLTLHSFLLPTVYVITNLGLVCILLSLYHNTLLSHTWTMLTQEALPYTIIVNMSGLVFGGLIIAYNWVGLILSIIMVVCLWRVLYQAGSSISTLKKRYKETISVLTTALEFRDPYTHGHSQRVSDWCRKIAQMMHLHPSEVEKIELGGLMHDVGKVGIADHILNKVGQLTKEEYAEVKNHTEIGEKILSELKGMDYVAAMAKQHHLYYNGDPRGYPDCTPGSTALIGARILSVADAWDAMTTDRPYRRYLTISEAVEELRLNSGIQFDPEVVEAFIRVLISEGLYCEECQTADRKARGESEKEKEKVGMRAC